MFVHKEEKDIGELSCLLPSNFLGTNLLVYSLHSLWLPNTHKTENGAAHGEYFERSVCYVRLII